MNLTEKLKEVLQHLRFDDKSPIGEIRNKVLESYGARTESKDIIKFLEQGNTYSAYREKEYCRAYYLLFLAYMYIKDEHKSRNYCYNAWVTFKNVNDIWNQALAHWAYGLIVCVQDNREYEAHAHFQDAVEIFDGIIKRAAQNGNYKEQGEAGVLLEKVNAMIARLPIETSGPTKDREPDQARTNHQESDDDDLSQTNPAEPDGCAQHQNTFRNLLTDITTHTIFSRKPQKHIILVHGEPGMGKSHLLHRFREIALYEELFKDKFNTVFIDWEVERYHSLELRVSQEEIKLEAALRALRQALKTFSTSDDFKAYDADIGNINKREKKVLNKLIILGKEDEFFAALYKQVGPGLIAKMAKFQLKETKDIVKVYEEVIKTGIGVSLEQFQKHLERLVSFLRSNLEPDEFQLFINPSEKLANDFATGLRNIASFRPLIIFQDTYDIIESIDPHLRTIIKNSKNRIIWIIASRKNLLSNQRIDVDYEREFTDRIIGLHVCSFNPKEANHFLKNYIRGRSIDIQTSNMLHQVTLGVPLALQMAADLWAQGVKLDDIVAGMSSNSTHEEIVRRMCKNILTYAHSDDLWALFFLAMQRRRDDTLIQSQVLRRVKIGFSLNAYLEELTKKYSSVLIYGGEYYLHDSAANFMREYLLSQSMRLGNNYLQQIAKLAMDASCERVEELEKNHVQLRDRFRSDDWKEAILDYVYWSFWHNEKDGWDSFTRYFIAALGYQPRLASYLLEVAIQLQNSLSRDGKKRLNILKLGIPINIYENALFLTLNNILSTKAMLEELEKCLSHQSSNILFTELQTITNILYSRII